jgi:general secretion pathway protein C
MRWSYLVLEKYRTVTNVIGTVLIAWILSAMVGQMIGLLLSKKASPAFLLPPGESDADRSIFAEIETQTVAYYLPICERNIFDSQRRTPCGGAPEEGEEVVEDMDSAPVRSDLPATLLGTLVSSNPEASFANIAPRGGTAANFYIEDTVMGEAKIYDIQRNRVFFIRNGHREYLEVDRLPSVYAGASAATAVGSAKEGIKRDGDKVKVKREVVDSVTQDLTKILGESRMVPNFENGVVNGFKIFAIKAGSIFQELGLKNGDVVQRINGTEIDTVEKAIPMMQLLKTEPSISIDLLRGGAKKTLSIEIQ